MQVQKYKLGTAVFKRLGSSEEFRTSLSFKGSLSLSESILIDLGATPLIESEAGIEPLGIIGTRFYNSGEKKLWGFDSREDIAKLHSKINELVDAVNALKGVK